MPRGKIDKYLGNLNFFFIRENTAIRENGGISAFVHGFLTEVENNYNLYFFLSKKIAIYIANLCF